MYNKICSMLLITYSLGKFHISKMVTFYPWFWYFNWQKKKTEKDFSIQVASTTKNPEHTIGALTAITGMQCRKGFNIFPAFSSSTYQPHQSCAIFSATSSTVKDIMTRTALVPNRWVTSYRFYNFLHLSLF